MENPERAFSRRVRIEYTDHTTQEITSYESCLSDRPEELHLALLEYFEPSTDEYGGDFDKDILFK